MNEVPNVGEHSERLVRLLEEQRDCYDRLRRLAERQRRLISDQDPESLLRILAERQRLVDRLGELGKELQPYRQEWANTYTQMHAERRRHVRGLLDEINTLLGAILISDAEDSRLLAARKQTVRDRLKQTASARTAGAAYATQAYQTVGVSTTDHEA